MLTMFSSNQTETPDPIIIAGAGIAGLTAAINLKKAGRNVVVHEKQSAIGLSRHGDYEGLENWIFEEEMHDYFSDHGFQFGKIDAHPIFHFQIHFSIKEPVKVYSAKPLFYLVKRGSKPDCLDKQLYEQCISAGVRFEFGSSAHGDFHIDSTGSKKAAAFIKGINFQTNLEDQVHLLLGTDFSPKGYAYMIILNGNATIAAAYKKMKNVNKDPLKQTIEFFQNKGFEIPSVDVFGSRGSFTIPMGKKFKHPYQIGEAGGFQDYLFGFGMRIAMASGLAAAKRLAGETDDAKRILRSLNRKCKISFVNRILYERLTDQQMAKIAESFSHSNQPLAILAHAYKWNCKNIIRWSKLKDQYEIRPA